ncbi:alpha-D-ribose 1-methylphosphonate 5-triphosphate synthase subunit PhnL [Desulfocicer vacuolatum DSM 3385]|uniref:Alpha-D-ribose 1-methylphosphonate 5-triphosphate synthase subunit PhnL n=1 Tax=Desulfocicer vacuolatum DSM 3385 TaxID=1121400 RepID=A0A1W2ER27_9BACT|nr:phosphonate C-P lyase system protein PhnL [Desulfocicer vacuolatum]SMD12170.1 alpha-D-ribose 1-methylphosphonate 5-triphosphate synthase subunit PhnL [Desulfocicer vacuolatum DSM 3385]
MIKMIEVLGLEKRFILHNQGGAVIDVFEKLNFKVEKGQCVALFGRSGSGKSTLLRSLYANYKPVSGAVNIRHDNEMIDITRATPRLVVEIRKHTMGYVSQFLRVIPRVSTFDIVASAHREVYGDESGATLRAKELLERLNIPQRLWSLAPATFSGGEQQRVNIARGFAVKYPILLLDEPTASLDAANRMVVVELIEEAKKEGTAVVGIFHDDEVREAVSNKIVEMGAA